MYKSSIACITFFASILLNYFEFIPESKAEDINLGSKVFTVSGQNGVFPLDSYFRSSSDGAKPLRYEIVSKNDPNNILNSINISNGNLNVASRALNGSVSLNIRATPPNFPVYDNVNIPENPFPTKPGDPIRYTIAAGMTPAQILTHYAFFTYNPDSETYDFTKLNEDQLRWVLKNHVNDVDPLVLDIEAEKYFGNDEIGRNNLARVLTIIRQERPNVKLLGYYLLFPLRKWYEAVNVRRAERDKALGLPSWYANNYDKFMADFNTWTLSNSFFRTQPVSSFAGGGTVAQKVSAVYPSLYTVVRDSDGEAYETTYNTNSTYFTVKSCGFQNGNQVTFIPANGATLPAPLSRWVPYYIVNSSTNNLSFQIAASAGGSPIKLASNFTSATYIYRSNSGRTLCQDKDVVDWITFARENIAEARKFGLPVYAYISPYFKGAGSREIEAPFFRMQLETVREIADGVVIWDESYDTKALRTNRAWWKELNIFLAAQKPRVMSFTININAPVPATPKIKGDVNGDSLVNGDDYVACSTGKITVGCDLNGDEKFDTSDLIEFLKTLSLVTMLGDINKSGVITTSDVTTCQSYTGQNITSSNFLCDFDNNKIINATDISLIKSVNGRIIGDLDNTKIVDSSDIITCFTNYTGNVKANKTFATCDLDGDKDVDNLDLGSMLAIAYRGCGSANGICTNSAAALTTKSSQKVAKLKVSAKKDIKNKRVLNKFNKKIKKLKIVS